MVDIELRVRRSLEGDYIDRIEQGKIVYSVPVVIFTESQAKRLLRIVDKYQPQ